jgi:hypothetical protein
MVQQTEPAKPVAGPPFRFYDNWQEVQLSIWPPYEFGGQIEQYLDATQDVPHEYGSLGFKDEAFVCERRPGN